MKKLAGRAEEKKILDELLSSNKAEFLAIYGRRRIGKTFLIRQYLSNHIVFDFTGSNNESTIAQLGNFKRVFSEQCFELENAPKDWSEAFKHISAHLKSIHSDKKLVVFLDELPWLDRPKSGFLSALEFFWNQHGSQIDNLLFIVCGSAASWMIKNIVYAKGGLYKRMTRNIELEPFTLAETSEFFQSKNLHFTEFQIIQLFMSTGGIPFYLDAVKSGMSVSQTIEALFFTKNGLLQKEFKPLYQSLFKKATHHIQIIEALSKHTYGINREKLSKETSISEGGSLSRALQNLIDTGFVKVINPYGKKKKDSQFRLTDLFSIFYLTFVNNTPLTNWQSTAQTIKYKSWCGYSYENIWLLHQKQILKALGIQGVETNFYSWRHIGNESEKGTQIDLVIERKDGIIHLCEVKFTESEYALTKDETTKLRLRRSIFKEITQSKMNVVTTLLTTYPAIKNAYYLEEVHSGISMEELFL